jgi:hypothetical protein
MMAVRKQARHRYFRLSGADIADALREQTPEDSRNRHG